MKNKMPMKYRIIGEILISPFIVIPLISLLTPYNLMTNPLIVNGMIFSDFVVSPFLCNFDTIYIPYIPIPRAHNSENTIPYDINGFSIKLYGVRSDINGITTIGIIKITKNI